MSVPGLRVWAGDHASIRVVMVMQASRSIVLLMGIFMVLLSGTVESKPNTKRSRIRAVKSWGYQLQGRNGKRLKTRDLAKSEADLLVIDYANGERPWTAKDVEKIARKPDGSRRIVLAYLSIGEAEDYRYYWKKAWKTEKPDFLADANEDWAGNFKVRYWLDSWQKIIIGKGSRNNSYLDRIVEAGFDGVYLDIVDAYEFFGPDGEQPEQKNAAQLMCQLLARIGHRARVHHKRPGFLLVPQNGATIIDELSDTSADAYLDIVDGIGAEDSFFFGRADHNNPLRPQKETIRALSRFRQHKLPVFAVDYLTRPKLARKFVRLALDKKFLPYVGHRELDRLVEQP
ncbi:MAG: endo alpha-1,4 polygalactosaminidase [Kofleriaceae bacterium]|nr:endo alpha-1,4 polygalactosaminidase [Kofleriaceae bacterium]